MSLHSPRATASRLTTREMAVLAMLGAMMFALKVAMMALPNIHPVAVIIIAGTLCFGGRMLYTIAVYVLLEGIFYGFGIWWVSYLYTWPLLMLIVLLFKDGSRLFWAVIAGIFGLCFGALCAIPYLFVGGWPTAFAYWLSGVTFDLMHAAGNFAMTLALQPALTRALKRAAGM